MIDIWYTREFLRAYAKLEPKLKDEVKRRIAEFRNPKNHASLAVHSLKGRMKGRRSFSVNYRYRIVFQYADKTKSAAYLFEVGDHDVYE